MKHALCLDCESRRRCMRPCRSVEEILREENRVMERHYRNVIVCYPMGREVHFTDLQETVDTGNGKSRQKTVDDFSNEEGFQFRTDECRLTKTAVFIDRFFNKVPCAVLAERFGVKENTIVSIYKQAVEQLERLIETLDMRKSGIKAMKPGKFTEDQKFFLLAHVFGFSQAEVSRMFNRDKNVVNKKVKRMADTYGALFAGHETNEANPA